MVPTVELPPACPFTCQVTAESVVLATLAVRDRVAPQRMVLLAGMTLAVATLIWRGCAPVVEYPHDSLMMLEYGSRLAEGQRPHVDYYSAMGFMAYALTAVGIALVGPCGAALGLGYLLLCPILTLWAWWLASARLAALPALLFAAMAGLLLAAPHAIGLRPEGLQSFGVLLAKIRFQCLTAQGSLVGGIRNRGHVRPGTCVHNAP